MKKIIIIIIFILFNLSAYADEEAITFSGKRVILKDDGTWEYKKIKDINEVKFRDFAWGQKTESIKKTISEKPVYENDRALVYKDILGGLETIYSFILSNGHLVRGKYTFTEEHLQKNSFIWDFENIDELLNEKYGQPAEHEEIWLNDLYKDQRQDWGMAISVGHLTIYSKWKLGDVTILHGLRGDNFDIEHVIEYTHKEMKIIENTLQKEQDKSKL